MYNQKLYVSLCADLFEKNMRLYWLDFLCTYFVFLAALALVLTGSFLTAALAAVVGGLAAYRCGSFIHEIVHFSKKDVKQQRFRYVWNLLFGIPMLSPSVLYMSHLDHHVASTFGTAQDPEYVPIKGRSYLNLFKFVFFHAIGPTLLVLLRVYLRPLSWVSPKLWSKLGHRGLALVINWSYTPTRKTAPDGFDRYALVLSTLYAYAYLFLILTGVVSLFLVWKISIVVFGSLILNGVRTLVAHRYTNYQNDTLNKEGQLLDSLNLTIHPLAGMVFAPVGLRFHALHHLLPALPYHNLAAAHQKLVATLPEGDAYHYVNVPTIKQAFIELREGKAPSLPYLAEMKG